MRLVMGLFLIFATFSFVDTASANDYKISATAYRVDRYQPDVHPLYLYEVCGRVNSSTGRNIQSLDIQIIPDSGRKNEGRYTTRTDSDGRFCQMMRVFGGKIEIKILSKNGVEASLSKTL